MDPMPNLERLDRLEQQLIAHPERHDQGWWLDGEYEEDDHGYLVISCHTTLCAAGWAATLEGGKWTGTSRLLAEDDDPAKSVAYESWRGLHTVSAPIRAQRLLGLNDNEATMMFYGSDTLEEVLEVIEAVRRRAAKMAVDS